MTTGTGAPAPLTLVVAAVRKEFDTPHGPLPVLTGVSFDLSAGRTLAVVGPSGSGKSTLLHIVGSLDRPTAGSVKLGQLEVASLEGSALADYRARRVGFIFQDHHLLPQLTAIENVMLPTLAVPTRRAAADRARVLLQRVGLADRMDSLPAKLSGGERQRVAIARAMINDPPLLLADEPTGNLDRDTASTVAELFVELARERSVMLVVVTHNLDLARTLGTCLELRHGTLTRLPAE